MDQLVDTDSDVDVLVEFAKVGSHDVRICDEKGVFCDIKGDKRQFE